MNPALHSSKNSEWETPQWLFDALDARHGFTLDAAATAENAKCPLALVDAFADEWCERGEVSRVFLNPPYGRGLLRWAERVVEQIEVQAVAVICCLVPARTDTKWFRLLAGGSPSTVAHVEFLPGRVTFELGGKPVCDAKGRPMPAPFPSAVITLHKRLSKAVQPERIDDAT